MATGLLAQRTQQLLAAQSSGMLGKVSGSDAELLARAHGNSFSPLSSRSSGSSGGSSISRATSNVNSAADMLSQIRGMADYNNAQAAEQARIQREWQEIQNAKAMEFNASEAAKNRDWQEMMSNTAHQREIADLQAAGLNPVLSASGGNGAAVTSGATASGVTSAGAKGETDMSATNALVNLFGTLLENQNKIQLQDMSARANMQVAELQTSTQRIIQDMINANSQLLGDKNNENAYKIAKLNYAAATFAAQMGYDASVYSTDHSKYGMINNTLSWLLKKLGFSDGDSDGVIGDFKKMLGDRAGERNSSGGSKITPTPLSRSQNSASSVSHYWSRYGR